MKKLKFAALMLLMMTFITGVSAQTDGDGKKEKPSTEERAKSATETLVNQLRLTSKQSEQLYTINFTNMQQIDSLMSNKEIKSKRKQVKAINEAKDEQIQEILTADQKVAYAKLIEEQEGGSSDSDSDSDSNSNSNSRGSYGNNSGGFGGGGGGR